MASSAHEDQVELVPPGPSLEAAACKPSEAVITACDASSSECPTDTGSPQLLEIQTSNAAGSDTAQPELQNGPDASDPQPPSPTIGSDLASQLPETTAAETTTTTLERPLTPSKHSTCQPAPSSPLSEPVSLPDSGDTVHVQTSPEAHSSSITRSSPASSPLSELDMDISGCPIEYDYDGPPGHSLLRLKPTPSQWTDFPALLSLARRLRAERDGCFKILLPDELRDPLPEKAPQNVPANAYRVRQIKQRMFWQVSTVRSDGVFSSSEPEPETDSLGSADAAIKSLKTLFNKNKERQMRNVRYRVDVPAWTAKQRREAGVPERSPIHPLRGDKLDHTKAIIPGIHTPYVYESGPHFGASFQFHAEDFRLASLNHLYKGRKIWIVIPSTAVDTAEEALKRNGKCSQFMRHRAEFFFPERLEKMGIPYRIVDQRPGETIVVLPDAYHEGFSTGYTIAEAKNYADPAWTTETYQPCQLSCQLATAIPAEFMRPLREGEERLDLCADYGDGMVALQQPQQQQQRPQQHQQQQHQQQPMTKRSHEHTEDELLLERKAKQLKVY